MSETTATTLSRDHLKKLLASVGTMASELPVPSYTEHDWRACRFFNDDQMDALKRKATRLEDIIGTVFFNMCQCAFTVSVKDLTQVSAHVIMDGFNQDSQASYLAIGLEPESACGVLALPERTTQFWAKAALGETDAEFQEDTVLSELETSLLNDLCATLAASITQMDPHLALVCDSVLTSHCPVQWPSTENLLLITLSIQNVEGKNETESTLVLPCACYAPLVGKVCDEQETSAADTDYSVTLKKAINQLRVPMTAHLGTLSLTVQDLVSLQSNDILVLDKSVNQSLDVEFSGKKVFQGVPGQHRGQLAVLITDSCTPVPSRTCA